MKPFARDTFLHSGLSSQRSMLSFPIPLTLTNLPNSAFLAPRPLPPSLSDEPSLRPCQRALFRQFRPSPLRIFFLAIVEIVFTTQSEA